MISHRLSGIRSDSKFPIRQPLLKQVKAACIDWVNRLGRIKCLNYTSNRLNHLHLLIGLYISISTLSIHWRRPTPRSPILPCKSEKAPICSTRFFRHISHSAFNASAAEREMACVEERDGTRYDKTGGRWAGWNLNHSSYASVSLVSAIRRVMCDSRIRQTTVSLRRSSPRPEGGL